MKKFPWQFGNFKRKTLVCFILLAALGKSPIIEDISIFPGIFPRTEINSHLNVLRRMFVYSVVSQATQLFKLPSKSSF